MVYDENRSPIFDLCATKRSGSDQFYLRSDAKYLIIRASLFEKGAINGIFNMNYFETDQFDISSTTTTTSKPPIIDKILPKGKNLILRRLCL